MLAASLMLLLGSCSQEIDMDSTGNRNNGSDKAGVVRFKLGGSAGEVITRAGGELQTAEEKRVSTLLAVVFKDLDGNATTNEKDGEDDADTFIKVIDVLNGGGDLTGNVYSFEIGEPGAYQICFVANPSDALKGKIENLTTTSPISAFKGFVEEQLPETKPMLMTSSFLGAKIGNAEADLGTVSLSRVMSRIDIINQADGVTITKAVLKNRTIKSVLLSDAFGLNDDYLDDEEYTLDLEGNSAQDATDNAYTAKIYSYEQYGNSADGKAPTMELTYKMAGDDTKEYKHTVVFKNAQDQDVNLKRNYLYRVKVSNSGSSIRFNLSVADWNEGEEFEVSGDQIAEGTGPYSTAALGDIMLKDGTLVKADAITEEQKQNAIGIVAFLYNADRLPKDGVKNALAAKGQDSPHGLVMALKNAGTDLDWGPNTVTDYVSSTLGSAYKEGKDGYTITSAFKGNSEYPAFTEVANYENSAPTSGITCTGWYLPSMGEWIDILGSTGIGNMSEVDGTKTFEGNILKFSGKASVAVSNLNAHLDKVGGNNVDKFILNESKSIYYLSSSELDYRSIYVVFFDNNGDFNMYNMYKGSADSYVRYIFAF